MKGKMYGAMADKAERSYSELGTILITPFFNYAFAFYFVQLFTCYLIQAYIHQERLAFNGELLNVGVYSFFFIVLRMGRSRGICWVSYFFCKILFVLSSPFILSGILNPKYLNIAGLAIMISLLLEGLGYMFWTISLCFRHGSEVLNMDIDTFINVMRDREKKQKK